jgi:hypothetical protein
MVSEAQELVKSWRREGGLRGHHSDRNSKVEELGEERGEMGTVDGGDKSELKGFDDKNVGKWSSGFAQKNTGLQMDIRTRNGHSPRSPDGDNVFAFERLVNQ